MAVLEKIRNHNLRILGALEEQKFCSFVFYEVLDKNYKYCFISDILQLQNFNIYVI